MLHSEDSHEMERKGRDQWIAMQSAYAEYRRSSEALSSYDLPIDDFPNWRSLQAQQRAAFEKYLEARMVFLESRFDETATPGESPVDPPTREREHSAFRARFAGHGLLVLALAVGLVCSAAFWVNRAQKRVRALETARDDLRAELSTARADIQRVSARMDAGSPVQPSPIPAAELQQKPRSAPPVRRNYYRFLLPPSHRFKRVGPIEVSVRSVDAKQNRISLSIQSESVKMNFQHVPLNQPVRIDGGGRGPRMELVVDRIAADGVHGHLIEFQG
jgi:hypothetical protein